MLKATGCALDNCDFFCYNILCWVFYMQIYISYFSEKMLYNIHFIGINKKKLSSLLLLWGGGLYDFYFGILQVLELRKYKIKSIL